MQKRSTSGSDVVIVELKCSREGPRSEVMVESIFDCSMIPEDAFRGENSIEVRVGKVDAARHANGTSLVGDQVATLEKFTCGNDDNDVCPVMTLGAV